MALVLAIATFVGISSYFAVQHAGLTKGPARATKAAAGSSAAAPMTAAAATASVQSGTSPAASHAASASSSVPGPGSVTIGALKFPYAVGWRPADQGSLPARMHGSSDIRIIAGLCDAVKPDKDTASAKDGCDVGMTYLLFGQGRQFPALADLESTFDTGFARSFPGFMKVSAQRMASAGAVPYLRYEFTYARDGQQYREIVAAYSTRHQGIVTVSSGTDSSIRARLKQIDKVISSATLA